MKAIEKKEDKKKAIEKHGENESVILNQCDKKDDFDVYDEKDIRKR